MDNTLMTIIGIFLAAILIFVIPLMSITERNDDITQSVIQTATAEFVDKISVSGVIKPSDYEEYIQKLNSTGNTYDVEIEVQHLDENFGKKNGTTSKDLIGENERYSTFTTEILDNMYLADGTSESYLLKKGDNVIVTAKNTNRTMAQTLRTFIYKVTGKGTYEIIASNSSMVVNDGVEIGNIQIGDSNENVQDSEILYLYNYGDECESITGGWYPSIMDTWYYAANHHTGALYEKTSSYLNIGDKSTSAFGNGGYTTGAKIEELANYDYLNIKLKVSGCSQFTTEPFGFNVYISTTPLFVEYKDYNNNRTTYKYKQVNRYQEFKDVAYQEKTAAQLREIVMQDDNTNIHDYSSGKYGLVYANRIWNSDQESDIGKEIELKIYLREDIKEKIRNTNGCHFSISGYAHENLGLIDIEVYEIYLSKGNIEEEPEVEPNIPEQDITEEYTSYSIGDTVTVKGETFYVIANSDETQEKVLLLAKECIDTTNLVQSSSASTVAFSKTYYWENDSAPYDLIELNEDDIAARYAYEYGIAIGGAGRLMTYNEVKTLKDEYSAMIYGKETTNGYLDYWLGSSRN